MFLWLEAGVDGKVTFEDPDFFFLNICFFRFQWVLKGFLVHSMVFKVFARVFKTFHGPFKGL